MEKHFFFVQTTPPPFQLYLFIYLFFEAFPHLGKDSAQNFYNYKYQMYFGQPYCIRYCMT